MFWIKKINKKKVFELMEMKPKCIEKIQKAPLQYHGHVMRSQKY